MFKRFRHQIIGPLILGWLLLTAGSLAVRLIAWHRLKHSLDNSARATQLGEALDTVFGAMKDAETGQRGYLLTGNEIYLEPFKKAENTLATDFDNLAAIIGTDHDLENGLLKLRGLTEVKMAEMRETIRLRREKSLKESLAVLMTNQGKEAMDRIRETVEEMRLQRQSMFSRASEKTRENFQVTQTFGIITGFLALGAGVIALLLVRVSYLQEKARGSLLQEKLNAEKIVVEKSAFLANMSHEIRTPMNAILGFSELLESEALTPRQSQYIRSIRSSGSSLLQLINDVLDLSKMEAGKLELHLEPTDMREMVDFLKTMFSQQAAAKSLDLDFKLAQLPHALLLDRLRLRQILINLVGNAMKFTPKGKVCVNFEWQPQGEDRSRGTLVVEVADTGVGIVPLKQLEIFKPFVQSVPQRNLEQQGSGLGLSIVQRLVQVMGGTIGLQSVPDQGSTFRLTLTNVAVSARLPVSDDLESGERINFNDFVSSHLVVVDDNATNRELMVGLFAGTHHHLRLATNGQEALHLIASGKPDLVLLDVRMPVMDGRSALAAIRKTPGLELLPVIAVTASSHANDEDDLRNRFSSFMRKPFSRKALYDELSHFLRKNPVVPPAAKTGETAAEPPGPALMATARSLTTHEACATELRFMQQNQWPLLRDSLAIKDTLAFARRLNDLGQQMQSTTLKVYAGQLRDHAEAYSVREMEKRLTEFPALVEALEKNAPPR